MTARQKAWDRLREGPIEDGAKLAEELGVKPGTIQPYLTRLRAEGYVETTTRLLKDTGPIAPSIKKNGDFVDENLWPRMKGSELLAAIEATGLSRAAWLVHHGFSEGGTIRLGKMILGDLPVSREIERAAKAENKEQHASTD